MLQNAAGRLRAIVVSPILLHQFGGCLAHRFLHFGREMSRQLGERDLGQIQLPEKVQPLLLQTAKCQSQCLFFVQNFIQRFQVIHLGNLNFAMHQFRELTQIAEYRLQKLQIGTEKMFHQLVSHQKEYFAGNGHWVRSIVTRGHCLTKSMDIAGCCGSPHLAREMADQALKGVLPVHRDGK